MTDLRPMRVLVAGGGVAGIETLLALRDLAGGRVAVTLIAPTDTFVHRPESITEPFGRGRPERYPLADIAQDTGARFECARIASVDARRGRVTTTSGERVGFDELVIAVGAEPYAAVPNAITWDPDGAHAAFRRLVSEIDTGAVSHVAVVVPASAAWPLPAYELALLLAHHARSAGRGLDVTLVTAERAPLSMFGGVASEAVAAELRDSGIELQTQAYRAPEAADRVIAVPSATGPRVVGLPADEQGFVPVDEFGRVPGRPHVWAAGDGTGSPLKQGGIASQQADVVATSLAALAGAPVEPHPFRPVLRAVLVAGDHRRWMLRREDDRHSVTATHALWWPPDKIAGRYLAPYLAALRDLRSMGAPGRPPVRPGGLDLQRELA